MKLKTVISCVNNNPQYYLFIPKQILFWRTFNIQFYAVFVGNELPAELNDCSNNIILWNHNLHLNTSFVAQNLRIYYPSLIELPDDEMVMITDMDMLPTNDRYYCSGLNDYKIYDFIYYRHIDGNQIYMCYNAAHPSTWKKVFHVRNIEDIIDKINTSYNKQYNGIPGSSGWFTDQEIMYSHLIKYPHLQVLNRPIKRLEVNMYKHHINIGKTDTNFIRCYDDVHFHRSYISNEPLIIHAEKQLLNND